MRATGARGIHEVSKTEVVHGLIVPERKGEGLQVVAFEHCAGL